MSNRKARAGLLMGVVALAGLADPARAAYLDIATITSGVNGNFAGSLDGIPVSGAAVSTAVGYSFNTTGSTFNESTINNTSPQYSYGTVYSPTMPLVDRIGYIANTGSAATITISFGAPVVNPRFHVANLDGATYTFAPTGGLTSISLISGNGGGGDGLQVSGNAVSDANPATIIGVDPTVSPPTAGARSAYGTISLNGAISVLTISVTSVGNDGGSFTLSSVPEPTTLTLAGTGAIALLGRRRHGVTRRVPSPGTAKRAD